MPTTIVRPPAANLLTPSRRQFLIAGISASCVPFLGSPAFAAIAAKRPVKRLKLLHAHTGEKLHTTYFIEGTYVGEAFKEINYFLRDFRNGEVLAMNHDLIETLSTIQNLLETDEPLIVNSGYRSSRTNAMLRRRNHGVARNSLHIRGMATDFHVKGRSVNKIARAARALRAGGVGEYRGSHFVHVDVGRVRSWSAR